MFHGETFMSRDDQYTEPDDAVMISEPVYYPFGSLVTDSGRRLVRNMLIHDEKGHYGIDFEVFEEHSVTFTSPSKTFNTAGLQIAEIIAHDPL